MAGVSSDKEMPEFMVGTCLCMCPNAEIRLRQREGLVHALEMAVGANGEKLNYGNPRMMVKEFSRSAAGHEIKPSDIRPLPVLIKTVKFLLMNSCCRTDMPWALVYQYVNDRLRAIRQDLCVQGIKNVDCIKLHLASVRFYVYAHYRTCEHELADFDPYLNKKTLMETLTLILSLYRDLEEEASDTGGDSATELPHDESEENWPEEEGSEEDVSERKIMKDAQASEKNRSEDEASAEDTTEKMKSLNLEEEGKERDDSSGADGHCAEESPGGALSLSSRMGLNSAKSFKEVDVCSIREEAESLYILVNFGSEEALSHALSLPKSIRNMPLVSLVLEMNTAWLTHNYCRVLHLSSLLPPLFLCAFHSHIAVIERKALAILSRSHSCKGQLYDKKDLCKTLFFSDSRNMTEACSHYGITVTEAGITFNKASFKSDAPMRKVTRLQWIEEKLSQIELSDLLIPQELRDADVADISLEPEWTDEEDLQDSSMDHSLQEDEVLAPEVCKVKHFEEQNTSQPLTNEPEINSSENHTVTALSDGGKTQKHNSPTNPSNRASENTNPASSGGNSVPSSPESGHNSISSDKTELRRRKRQEEKEAMARKVKGMLEKQRANEDWLEKKKNIYKPLAICVAFVIVGVGSGVLLYQYFNG